MSMTVYDLEKTVNSGLTTTVKRSEINFNQLFIDVDVEDIINKDVSESEKTVEVAQ